MRKFIAALAFLALVGATCDFAPQDGAEGVTLTHADGVFTLVAEPPVQRAFLRVQGENLSVDHDGCEVVEGAVECTLGEVASESVTVSGEVRLPPQNVPVGVVCRDVCSAIAVSIEAD